MRKNIFVCGDSILLLGEGNFSFALGLSNLGCKLNVTATCYEPVLTATQNANAETLKIHGACVLTGIDATKVHQHPLLAHKCFDKIVFNFPHTGGKMKIHENRMLLRQFFESATNILSKPNGQVIVSLCHGQGADYAGKRIWADSWQIVDMAGHANLLLVECSPFEWTNFPSYTNVGYRSLEKGFHSENAMVHVFCLVEHSLINVVQSVIDYYLKEKRDESQFSPYIQRLLEQNILEKSASPSSFVLKTLQGSRNLKFTCLRHFEKKVITKIQIESEVDCAFKMWKKSGGAYLLYSFYLLCDNVIDLREAPLASQTLFLGNDILVLFMQTVSELLSTCGAYHCKIFEKNNHMDSKGTKEIYLQGSSSMVLIAELVNPSGIEKPFVLIHTDSLASELFSLKCWRQLWSHNICVDVCAGKQMITGLCPYPVSYSFDVSFFTPNTFSEENFLKVLRDIAGEIVVSVTKLSKYCDIFHREISYCYRLSYLSYDLPLCRQSLINFHHNVLGRALEKILSVRVK